MLFPDSAKNTIANTFYDKTVEILNQETSIDAEGGVVRSTPTVQSTFQGNAQFTNLGEAQAELGLVESINILITCSTDVSIKLNDRIRYDGVEYVVTSVIPTDSHLTIGGRK